MPPTPRKDRRLLRRISLGIVGLLAAGLIASVWYAGNKGFTSKWRKFVVQEFQKRGVELSLNRLTLEPFRGIVAKRVRIYDNRDRKRVIAVVDEVRLVINYANLFQGRTFIEALDLRDANLDVPLNPAKRNGPKVEIRRLSGLLYLPPQQIYLSRLEAEVYGIQFRASGRLINPQKFQFFTGDRKEMERRADLAEDLISELKKLKYEGAPPQIDLRFSGDLGQPTGLFAEATLWAERVKRESYQMENVYLSAVFRDGIARLRQLDGSDVAGSIRASGSYDLETREGSLELHSAIDVQRLLRAVRRFPELEESIFYSAPEIDLTVRLRPDAANPVLALGQLSLNRFSYRSVIFDGLRADISWEGDRWCALDVDLRHRTGKISGDFLHTKTQRQSSLKSTIQRATLDPILTAKTTQWLPEIQFVSTGSVATEEPQTIARGAN